MIARQRRVSALEIAGTGGAAARRNRRGAGIGNMRPDACTARDQQPICVSNHRARMSRVCSSITTPASCGPSL